jgi:maltooligosyltrehalose trehalohydrolase
MPQSGRRNKDSRMTTPNHTAAWQPAFGANFDGDDVRFAVWAPDVNAMGVVLYDADNTRYVAMESLGDGRFEIHVPGIDAGQRYAFRIDGDDDRPDPYSRRQPEGVHGPSEVVDPYAFAWTDHDWPGITRDGQVIYELHVGTMTTEGTFAAIIPELPEMRRLGVTAIELMPVAQCPGNRNWGYDGVDLFAPSTAYGTPDDLRRLVDAAHREGLGVILDVVYNHLGPEGNYLGAFSSAYTSDRHHTAWGAGMNWDGPGSQWVRRFAIDNACHWVREYHIDGLRLDATHAIIDDSPVHLVAELTDRVRQVASPRRVVVYAEDGRHEIGRARPLAEGGEGLDGVWADDFHHEVRVMLTNARENYFAGYEGNTTGVAAAIRNGFGPTTFAMDVTRPDARDPAAAFVFCIQNHDQVGNRPFGDRLHHEISLDRYAVASTLLLFAPETPLLFMGQEFAASTPFLYFTDHPEPLGRLVTDGRRNEFAGFRAFHDHDLRDTIPDPQARSTFDASKLRLDERERHAGIYRLYRDLLALRRDDPVLRHHDRAATLAHALTAQVIAVNRWHGEDHRLLLANFGPEVTLDLAVTPDLTPLAVQPRHLLLTTTDERYDGSGNAPRDQDATITIPARSAVIWAIPANGAP